MFLTVHAVAGEVLTQSTTSPLVAFLIGFVSHFFVDALPHGDENIAEPTHEKYIHLLVGMTLVDLCLMLTVQGVLIWEGVVPLTLVPFAAAFGAMLPDGLQAPFYILKKPPALLRWYKKNHDHFHNSLGIHLGIKWGLACQTITLLLLIAALR